MKKGILFSLLLMIGIAGTAQDNNGEEAWNERTLIKKGTPIGFYLGTSLKAAELNRQQSMWVGGQIGLVANHRFNFGLAGYGLLTDVESNVLDVNGVSHVYEMGYGGFHLEPVLFSDRLVHVTFPVLLGAGGVAESRYRFLEYTGLEDDWIEESETSAFLVAEPGVNVEINVMKGLRFAVGGGYRYVDYSNLTHTSNNDLSGWTANFTMKVGWF